MSSPSPALIAAADLISLLGKGPAYMGLCALATLAALAARRRGGRALLAPAWAPLDALAWRLCAFWVIGTLLNLALKHTLAQPRPWWHDPVALPPLGAHVSSGFGMPSGHAQAAMGALLLAAALLGHLRAAPRAPLARLGGYAAVGLLVGWVPLTAWARVALHAHSPAQVAAGAAVGGAWLGLRWWAERAPGARGARALAALCAAAAALLAWRLASPAAVPGAWLEAIRAAQGAAPNLEPRAATGGALLAAGLGLSWALGRARRAG